MSTENVQNTRKDALLRDLHGALVEITVAMNRPQRDEELLEEAGVSLDKALFKLLVAVERLGPVSIVELAERMGLDHSTVSRQIGKLESLGLVARQPSETDRRVREAVLTQAGRATTDKIDKARQRMARELFETWEDKDVVTLVRLMSRFAEAFREHPRSGSR
ncbi:MarR family winged helix-turn-helix transcriptional regulator [Citreimonas salinaria]|uniref:DNA-binding transcriptional regulator, MarR family n=1 Tax=Citreimonas salinaria TaxID=321339 RepID=A0A1H3N7Q6_9RHOB|nr:MarR family transcriptional regulator [Citreimonas salinaria]SDY84981.1 DNA-binding transcriptional regulator, MarR family [Citreimonas salinaria]